MPNMGGQEVILFLLGQLLVAAGIWGGIRADIRNMHDKIKDAKDTADEAHERIDNILQDRHSVRRAK